jgi:hypothetical protein
MQGSFSLEDRARRREEKQDDKTILTRLSEEDQMRRRKQEKTTFKKEKGKNMAVKATQDKAVGKEQKEPDVARKEAKKWLEYEEKLS